MKPGEGKLPIGVDFAGGLHQAYELRPQLVEDEAEVFEDPNHGARAAKNSVFYAVCVYARRLEKLGEIPKESITPELLLKMKSRDMQELQACDRRSLPSEEPKGDQPA